MNGSINTNISAMTALKSLQMTNVNLEEAQNRISTGLRVSEAADNAAYWSIATTMRSDNKALSTVQDALGLGQAKVDIAYTGLNAAIDVVDEIKSKLVAAREPGVDRSKIQSEIAQLQGQLTSIADSSSFSGENWLSISHDVTADGALSADVVSSFTRSGANVSVGTLSITVSSITLFNADADAASVGLLDTQFTTTGAGAVTTSVSALDITAANVDDTDIDEMISAADTAVQSMTTAAADLGATKSRIEMQNDFIGNLMSAIDRGVSALVDADMSAESTRLSALQTQQQLGIQSLSIANSSAQSILALFR
ncbi:MAG: flagellin [Ahrensia sp.]|nr:flagellin [Ahrensia sp.]